MLYCLHLALAIPGAAPAAMMGEGGGQADGFGGAGAVCKAAGRSPQTLALWEGFLLPNPSYGASSVFAQIPAGASRL